MDSVSQLVAALANNKVETISLAAGHYQLDEQLYISRSVSVMAAVPGSVILDGQGRTRVLRIATSGIVELSGLNITRGNSNARGAFENGGGIWISDGPTVTLSSCAIYGNNGGTEFGKGGGIFARTSGSPMITLVNCIINGNRAESGGGLHVSGGKLALTNVNFTGNSGGDFYFEGSQNPIGASSLFLRSCHIYSGSIEYTEDMRFTCASDTNTEAIHGFASWMKHPCPPTPPPVPSHECSPDRCNVCGQCCHDYIPHGAQCNRCVKEQCSPPLALV